MMVLREVALPITTCILRRGIRGVRTAKAARADYIMPSKNSIGLLSSVRVMMAFFQLLV